MSADEFDQLGIDLGRHAAAFIKDALADEPADAGTESGVGEVTGALLYLIDGASKLLEQVRRQLVDRTPVHPEPAAGPAPESVIQGKSLLHTLKLVVAQVLKQPEALARHYASFASQALRVLQNDSDARPTQGDFRFKDRL